METLTDQFRGNTSCQRGGAVAAASLTRGSRIFLDYDQAALDAPYDQSAYAANREQLIKRRISDSELARRRIGDPERIAYGPTEIERLAIYRAGSAAAPVFGLHSWWGLAQRASREFAAPAEMFLAAGAYYVVPDFAWVRDVSGNLMVLAEQVWGAVAWVYENASRIGIDADRLYCLVACRKRPAAAFLHQSP